MQPESVIHAFLESVEVDEPRGSRGSFLVPLSSRASIPEDPGFITLPEARSLGVLEPGPAGIWINRGDQPVLALPGQILEMAGTSRMVSEPAIIPAASEGGLSLEPARARHREHVVLEASQCGTAIFEAGRLVAVLILPISREVALDLLLPDPGPGQRDDAGEALTDDARRRMALERTRRLFDQCRYASVQVVWQAGPLRTLRIRAPKVVGWTVLRGGEVLAMEIIPRAETHEELEREMGGNVT